MELTSYYDTVFYASSVTPGGWQYPDKYPEYPSKYPEYPQYSPATPPPTPLSPPYTPSPAAASTVPGAEAAEAAASPSFAFSPGSCPSTGRRTPGRLWLRTTNAAFATEMPQPCAGVLRRSSPLTA